MAALERFKAARAAAEVAPVYKPVVATLGQFQFGNRKDPFTGRDAFHSGLDDAAPSGTTVTAAGAGKVTFVGQISGYGNVVEITHTGGLVTRLGHLSSFIAEEGHIVSTGHPSLAWGSTGRSTGPHLHFEVPPRRHGCRSCALPGRSDASHQAAGLTPDSSTRSA